MDRALRVEFWRTALNTPLTSRPLCCISLSSFPVSPSSWQATSDVDRALRVEFWRAGSRSMKPVARAVKNGNVLKQRIIELFVSLHDLKVGAEGGRRKCD